MILPISLLYTYLQKEEMNKTKYYRFFKQDEKNTKQPEFLHSKIVDHIDTTFSQNIMVIFRGDESFNEWSLTHII